MNRLLDQLKQGLRRIGRGRLEVPGGVPTVSPVNDSAQETRLRTELDDALSLTAIADGGRHLATHIAAPRLGLSPDSDPGRIARERPPTA